MKNSFVEMLLSQKHLPFPIKCMPFFDKEKILKAICAFLNAQGGWIVLGIDNEYNVVGLENIEIESEIQKEITNYISPLPLVYLQRETYNNEEIILITIKGSLPPYSYKNRYYIIIL